MKHQKRLNPVLGDRRMRSAFRHAKKAISFYLSPSPPPNPSLSFHSKHCPSNHFFTGTLPSSLLMASLFLPKHSLPSLLSTQIPKTPSLHSLPLVSKSSHSQFYGLTFSSSPPLPLPSSSSSSSPKKASIFAKVHCLNLKIFRIYN